MKAWLAAVLLAAGMSGAPAPAAETARPLRSSFDLQVPVPPSPVQAAGATQLVYELHLSNFAGRALELRRVQVVAADDGRVLADFHGNALEARLHRPGPHPAEGAPRSIAAGMHAVLYLELSLAGAAPQALRHRIEYADDAGSPVDTVETGRIALAQASLPVLGPPLRGGPWAAIHHPSWPRGHRRMLFAVDGRARIPGRHAVDWIRLDADGRYARGDQDRVADWYGYGAEVLAVADATVAAARDDVAESASVAANAKHPLADAAGNYIALNLGANRFAFYEHLQPGSMRVKPGERVRRGQVIARLGFTGDSTGPHLHFHVADGATPLGAEGTPHLLQSFELLGAYDNLDDMGRSRWRPRGDDLAPLRRAEMPGSNSVVVFPD